MVFGSHPTGDVQFREDLMKSIVGEWYIEVGKSERNFKVIYANTFDEPVDGLMNVLLTENGQHYQHTNIRDGRALVIDLGGFTTDFLLNLTYPMRITLIQWLSCNLETCHW